jgi:hypothetical protein
MNAQRSTPEGPQRPDPPPDRKSMIRTDLEHRLRGICANFSDAEFRALIDVMTERKLKSERLKIP